MRWRIQNLHVLVEDADSTELNWLASYLSYRDSRWVPSKGRIVDTHTCLLNRLTNEFPAGLARAAYQQARKEGIELEAADDRVEPCEPDLDADLEWLRHHPAVPDREITHQIEAIEAVAKKKRGILWLPTGSGKTEIAIGLTRRLPCRWLFFVHRADLLRQAADRYEVRTGEPAGIVGDGMHKIPDGCRFVVCSFQTAHRGIEGNKKEVLYLVEQWAEGIICDEVHSAAASTFFSTVMRTEAAYYRVGLSATPLARSDGRNLLLIGGIGPVIYRVQPQVLVELGLLAKPTIRMLEHKHEHSGKASWRSVYSHHVVKSPGRNATVLDAVRRAEKPCLVFVTQLKHGRELTKKLEEAGMPTRFAYGQKSTAQRSELVTQLERGYCEVLVCNVVFQEGVDIPSLRSVVIAGGGASKIASVQRMGRGMRADAKTGKTAFEVWDVADVGCGCTDRKSPKGDNQWALDIDDDLPGTIHKSCKWLEKHTRARRRAYEQEGFEVIAEGSQLSLPSAAASG